MATVNLGRVKPIYRGNYSAGAVYQPLDFLRYGNLLYVCKQQAPAGTLPTNTTYFDVITDEGDVTPGPNRIPKARADGTLDIGWLGETGLPKARPTLNLDFANGRHLDPRITFTRASSATYFDAMGVLRTAAAGEPRFDYDPVTGECLGLLVEGQATNLLTYSSQPENWTKVRVAITPSSLVSPDGDSPLGLMIENGETADHYATITTTFESGKTYTASVFAKEYTAGSKRYLTILLQASAVFDKNYRVTVDLSDGSIQTVNSPVQANAEHVGNGLYRVSVTATAIGSGNTLVQFRLSHTFEDGLVGYEGDGVSGVYIWGAQLEEGSAPSSYIKTEASQVTRAADSASVPVDLFPFNGKEGTLIVDSSLDYVGALWSALAALGGASAYIGVVHGTLNIRAHARIVNESEQSSPERIKDLLAGERFTAAMTYSGTGGAVSYNGAAAQTFSLPSNGLPANVQALGLGNWGESAAAGGKHIRRVTYYPRALPDAELIALSSL